MVMARKHTQLREISNILIYNSFVTAIESGSPGYQANKKMKTHVQMIATTSNHCNTIDREPVPIESTYRAREKLFFFQKSALLRSLFKTFQKNE